MNQSMWCSHMLFAFESTSHSMLSTLDIFNTRCVLLISLFCLARYDIWIQLNLRTKGVNISKPDTYHFLSFFFLLFNSQLCSAMILHQTLKQFLLFLFRNVHINDSLLPLKSKTRLKYKNRFIHSTFNFFSIKNKYTIEHTTTDLHYAYIFIMYSSINIVISLNQDFEKVQEIFSLFRTQFQSKGLVSLEENVRGLLRYAGVCMPEQRF